MKAIKYAVAVVATLGCTAFGAYLHSRYAAAQQQHSAATTIPAFMAANTSNISVAPTDFTTAAEASVNAVVHVKIAQQQRSYQSSDDALFHFFFGPRSQMQQAPQPILGSGSGVIIASDGYIITNNHVIERASKIEVVLNDNRQFEATVIGTDPTTDIALLKIEADNLSYLQFGNSDALRVGEWVLAVGNPFNLTSTVTAGVVSAKSRRMGIINNAQNISIESFIQTDAAVNPGNSGGALVNTRGELVGINTAIASNTGSYAGYSFAVPANIAQKVVQDLKEYGEVQRALLGVTISDVTPELQKELGLEKPVGVAVRALSDGGAAKDAGVEIDDVIMAIDGEEVKTVPELQEKIGRKRPGDSVKLDLIRSGKTKQIIVTLRNIRGTTSVVKVQGENSLLGAQFAKLSEQELNKLNLRYGIKIEKLEKGKLQNSGVKEGFVITKANRQPITSVGDLEQVAATASEGLFIAGIYPNGKVAYYAINLQE